MVMVLVLSAAKSMGQAPPHFSEATKQRNQDITNYNNLAGQYDTIVAVKYTVEADLVSLNRQLADKNATLAGQDSARCNQALRKAARAIVSGTAKLIKGDFDINTMGYQFLAIEKAAYFYGDYQVSLAIGGLAKQYWDDAGLTLSGASASFQEARSQLNIVRAILNPAP
jgi:hypothetical protein